MNLVQRYNDGKDLWEIEPNCKEFIHKGVYCVILRHPSLGHLCGYVELPARHPFKNEEPYELPVDVHGGITYGGELSGYAGYFIGFDCAHAGDYSPYMGKLLGKGPCEWETYKDMTYVEQQTRMLADQVIEAGKKR